MVHCGFEGTAANDAVKNPLKMFMVSLRGVKTDGPMAPDISLANQRKADYVFSDHVERKLTEIRIANPKASKKVVAAE